MFSIQKTPDFAGGEGGEGTCVYREEEEEEEERNKKGKKKKVEEE